jgi:hypothetical protein
LSLPNDFTFYKNTKTIKEIWLVGALALTNGTSQALVAQDDLGLFAMRAALMGIEATEQEDLLLWHLTAYWRATRATVLESRYRRDAARDMLSGLDRNTQREVDADRDADLQHPADLPALLESRRLRDVAALRSLATDLNDIRLAGFNPRGRGN